MAQRLRPGSGTEPIDHAKVARVFPGPDNPDPPMHTVLGSDAVDLIAGVMRDAAVEHEVWAPIGRSVDFG